jgi:hypothetical protein
MQHPQLSIAAHFHSLIDYNKTGFAPPGCNIIVHKKLPQGRIWAPHGKHGYSFGPAMITADVKMYTSLQQLAKESSILHLNPQ